MQMQACQQAHYRVGVSHQVMSLLTYTHSSGNTCSTHYRLGGTNSGLSSSALLVKSCTQASMGSLGPLVHLLSSELRRRVVKSCR